MLRFKESTKDSIFCSLESSGFYQIFNDDEEIGCLQLSTISEETKSFLVSEVESMKTIDQEDVVYFNSILDTLIHRNALYLDVISIDEDLRGLGYGKEVIERLKKETTVPILLFSIDSAKNFWCKMNFSKLFEHVYVYEKTNQMHFN